MGVPERPEDEDARRAWRQLAEVGNIGVFMVASVVIGLALGVALDRWTGYSPLFTLILIVAGIASGFREMFRVLGKLDATHRTTTTGKEPRDHDAERHDRETHAP